MTEETQNIPVQGAETEQQNVANNGQTTNNEQNDTNINSKDANTKELLKNYDELIPGEGTAIVYISGMLNGKQIDCAGPTTWPYKLTRPQWPVVPALPQYDPSKVEHPKFDWGKGKWIDYSKETTEKAIDDLQTAVKNLQAEKQDTTGLQQQVDIIQQGQTQTTAVLGQLLPAVQELTKFAANLQKQESTTQAQPNTAKEGDAK